MKKKILGVFGLILLFLGVLFGTFFMISKLNKTNIYKAYTRLENINTAKVKISSNKMVDGENVRFLYNFNFNKKFTNDKYTTPVIATEGNFGIELDKEEIGFYAPLCLVFDKDLVGYLTIDESYEDIFGIPGGEVVHWTATSLRKNVGLDIDYDEMKEVFTSLKRPIGDYLKEHKNDFTFYRSEKQALVSGTIGRLALTLDESKIESFYKVFMDNVEEVYLERYKINSFFDTLRKEYMGGLLYVDIYGDNINKISLIGANASIEIEISNINNSNSITIPSSDFVELVNYFKNGGLTGILSLFGIEVEVEVSKIDFLKNNFADFTSYMIGCLDYSDKSNFEYANICIEEMGEIISSMKSKIFNEEVVSIEDATYSKYIEFFEELLNYCIIYKDSCEDTSVDMSEFLKESTNKLDSISKELNIDIGDLTN